MPDLSPAVDENLRAAPLRARTRRFARRSGGEALGVDVDVAVADLLDVAAQLWPVVAAGDVDGARRRDGFHGVLDDFTTNMTGGPEELRAASPQEDGTGRGCRSSAGSRR